MKNTLHQSKYLNNGRYIQNNPIASTKFNNNLKRTKSINNGRIFQNKIFEIENTLVENSDKNSNKNVFSWVLNTINPLNHIPLVGSIKKISTKGKETLDIVQAAIGGAIYGGGPLGLARGVGTWFLQKLIPKDVFAVNEKKTNDNKIVNNNGRFQLEKSSSLKNANKKSESYVNSKSIYDKIKEQEISVNNLKNKNFYINHNKEFKSKIDINA